MKQGITYKQIKAISDYINDINRLELCISFWECRIVRGWLAPIFLCHNLHCMFKAEAYREKKKNLMLKLTSPKGIF